MPSSLEQVLTGPEQWRLPRWDYISPPPPISGLVGFHLYPSTFFRGLIYTNTCLRKSPFTGLYPDPSDISFSPSDTISLPSQFRPLFKRLVVLNWKNQSIKTSIWHLRG